MAHILVNVWTLFEQLSRVGMHLCDDGSTDETKDIISNYVDNDKRFILLSQANAGVSTRNTGMEHIRKVFLFVDGDDLCVHGHWNGLASNWPSIRLMHWWTKVLCNLLMSVHFHRCLMSYFCDLQWHRWIATSVGRFTGGKWICVVLCQASTALSFPVGITMSRFTFAMKHFKKNACGSFPIKFLWLPHPQVVHTIQTTVKKLVIFLMWIYVLPFYSRFPREIWI